MTSSIASHPRRWLILALVLCAECMDMLDSSIVNVAAPTIRNDLHTSASALEWVIGGYALMFAVVMITGARLGDIYGRRRLFAIGAAGFVLASTACGLAVSPGMLIACRLAQGGAAALMVPQGLGIIRSAFSARDLPGAFAVFGPVIGLSAVLGPIVGGALVSADAFGTGWRLIFFVNLPLGLAAAIGAVCLIPESRVPRPPRLDVVGAGLAAAAMGLLVYPLIEGRAAGWPAWTYLMGAGSLVALGALALWVRSAPRHGRDPLVVTSVFSHRAYTAGLGSILVFFAAMSGTLLTITLFLQFGEHFSPIHAGLTLAPFAFGAAAGAALAGAVLAPRFGRPVLQVGAIVFGVGAFWLRHQVSVHGLHTGSLTVAAPELVLGIGLGMLVSPLFDFVLAAVAEDEVGSASGVLNAVQQLAGAIGVAVFGTIFFGVLHHAGFAPAIERCLLVVICSAPVLVVLCSLLPRHARPDDAGEAHAAADAGSAAPTAGDDRDSQAAYIAAGAGSHS
jgi:EmrB/QacA subfamily drug resistance transporter